MFKVFYYSDGNRVELLGVVKTLSSSEKLGGDANECTIRCNYIAEDLHLKRIEVEEEGQLIFGGYVIDQSSGEVGDGIYDTELACVDYAFELQHRVLAEVYADKTPTDIFNDVISKIGSGFNSDGVQVNPDVIPIRTFKYDAVTKVFDKLLELSYGWYWYVDASKTIHYFKNYETIGSPIQKKDIRAGTLDVQSTKSIVVNRIWIIGAKQAASTPITDYFESDGIKRRFAINYEPNYVSVTLNGDTKAIKTEKNDDGIQDFLYDKKNKVLIIPNNIDPIPTGTVALTYRPTKQIIDYFDAPGSSDLLIEKAIVNKEVDDKLTARKYGKAEINRKAVKRRVVSFGTFSKFKIGEKRTVDLVDGPFILKGSFIVTSVSTTYTLDDRYSSVTMVEIV